MRLLLAVLLLFPMLADAVERDLDDCTIGSTPTAFAPLDLDNCTIDDGDEITGILTGLASTYSAVYVRAPSRAAWVVSDYIDFTVDQFRFFEDESARNTLLVQHKSIVTNTPGFWTMWRFSNSDTVVIGGPNLSMTLRGNHPGLANCTSWPNWSSGSICDQNQGLVEMRMTNGDTATLFDVRANIKFSQHYAIYTSGSTTIGGTTNKITQFNVAGLMYATSGIFWHTGVKNAWADPDRTVLSDPYVRVFGWTGEAPGKTENGLLVGCVDQTKDQLRVSGFVGYYFDSMTGGFTVQYGGAGLVPRDPGLIGTAEAPFIVRVSDLGISGPGTAYPAGVRVKFTGEALFFKGDPAGDMGVAPSRFLHFIKVPDTYGSGPTGTTVTGCTVDSNWNGGNAGNFARLENNVGSTTQDYQIRFSGDWRTYTQGGTFFRGDLIRFGSATDTYPVVDNTVIASQGTDILDTVVLRDGSTLTGPGSFASVQVTDVSAAVQGQNSTVTDTTLSGSVAISDNTSNTTVNNVNFTGTARAVVTIGANSDATVLDLCVPDGSTITGTGTLTYEGNAESLPYTIPNGTQNCSITANARPDAPGAP